MTTYSFSAYEFSSKEIDQICELVDRWAAGALRPVRQTRMSKQVLAYAQNWGLLEVHGLRQLRFTEGYRFDTRFNLPAEALWRLVQPMLGPERSIGRSLAKHKGWATLGIYPEGHRHASDASLQEQIDILIRLQQYGYLIVQIAGNVWDIARVHHAA